MESKAAALENEVASLRSTLAEMKSQADEHQEKLMEMLTKGMEKLTSSFGWKKLQGNLMDEFRQSVKKVELLMFNGEDPAGWISQAEVYF